MSTISLGAIDIGNTSGRVMLVRFDGKKMALQEISRFHGYHIPFGNYLKCDVLHLWGEILAVLNNLRGCTTLAVDSWAVDFALLGKDDDILLIPHHHRDPRTKGLMKRYSSVESRVPWYQRTGIAFQPINTSLQLLSMTEQRKHIFEQASSFLMIADLLNFLLTGTKQVEATNASTTQLISLKTHDWDKQILQEIGVPESIFPRIMPPETFIGSYTPALVGKYDLDRNTKIVSAGSHDTASALFAIPFGESERSVIISSGTWSLFGTILDHPITNLKAMRAKYNNELGIDRKTRFLKNIMGMWILESVLKEWETGKGISISYDELLNQVAAAGEPRAVFVPDLERFFAPLSMIGEIHAFIADSHQEIPKDEFQLVRMILEGLAFAYREAKEELVEITGEVYTVIHIVGGGSRNCILNQLVSDITDLKVIAGPVEATVMGNILSQLEYQGEISSFRDRYEIITASTEMKTFFPHVPERRDDRYRKYLTLKAEMELSPESINA